MEFKNHYFKLQQLINSRVHLSLKYDQLKSPEIHSALISPITKAAIAICESQQQPNLKVSTHAIFTLLLIRYEYLIQSESNLICYDLLITKATVCEILAVRMLREYKSQQRVQMILWSCPLSISGIGSRGTRINTLELCVVSKSKLFLSQPIIVQILDRFYNGKFVPIENCIQKDGAGGCDGGGKCKCRSGSGSGLGFGFGSEVGGNDGNNDDEKGLLLGEEMMRKWRKRSSLKQIIAKVNTVPKYQNIVINSKLIAFATLYFLIIFKRQYPLLEWAFWSFSLSLNIEMAMKLMYIDWVFIKMVIWNYIDFCLITLLNFCFILRFVTLQRYYNDFFSLIGIILFPRILSVFGNYQFFNLIVVSFNKMIWHLLGLIMFFFTLISGFYFSFIALNINQSNGEILFNMVKIFFGFTPSVWNSWDDYNTLGKIMQMLYLFLLQFIVGTILAICLSGVFHKARENADQEFAYTKSINMVSYFKMAKLNQSRGGLNRFLQVFKLPVALLISVIEIIKMKFERQLSNEVDFKNFVFFTNEVNVNGLKMGKRNQQTIKNHQSISTLGGVQLRTASTDSFFIDQLLNRKYGGVGTSGGTGLAATASAVGGAGTIMDKSVNIDGLRTLSKTLRQSQGPQGYQPVLQPPFSIPRRPTAFQQSPMSYASPSTIRGGYIPIGYYGGGGGGGGGGDKNEDEDEKEEKKEGEEEEEEEVDKEHLDGKVGSGSGLGSGLGSGVDMGMNLNMEYIHIKNASLGLNIKPNKIYDIKEINDYEIDDHDDDDNLDNEDNERLSINSETGSVKINRDSSIAMKIDTHTEDELDRYDSDETF
ncbi:hypothetical protein PVL30_003473 [Lodderomyces elongisporus]|uniref:uncharacterized protein n=1 Tax=Lodderomyces elongisporus TaxID=36914 RepID=UPI0029234A93|nr:uncharacterized protein PVL30_003473 [Lodderomyces elongisporus]WLF79709.1 hypothetical protein PVL30_003473 [Lodderomyces elongisporus]